MFESIYTDKFNFSETVMDLSQLNIVDPQTMKIANTDDNYIVGDNDFMKHYFGGISMANYRFANTLYNISKSHFKDLVAQKSTTEDSMKFRSSRLALVVDSTAISLLEGSTLYLNKFLESLRTYYDDPEYLCEYTYKESMGDFKFSATHKSTGNGVIIQLWLKSMWVKVNQFYTDNLGVLVTSPFSIVDKKLDEDINIVLDKGVCTDYSVFDESTRNDYLERLSVPVSIDELSQYLKSIVGLKLKTGVEYDPYTVATDKDYSESSTQALVRLLSIMQSNAESVVYYSSYLKRAVTITAITHGVVVELASSLVKEGKLDINELFYLYDKLMRHSTNYDQLNI